MAVKELTGNVTKNKELFLTEARIMAQLDHPNVIKLHGICQEKNPILLVTEFMNQGSLEKYLRSRLQENKKLDNTRLLEILYQVQNQSLEGPTNLKRTKRRRQRKIGTTHSGTRAHYIYRRIHRSPVDPSLCYS